MGFAIPTTERTRDEEKEGRKWNAISRSFNQETRG
jgi:hypothetical protein